MSISISNCSSALEPKIRKITYLANLLITVSVPSLSFAAPINVNSGTTTNINVNTTVDGGTVNYTGTLNVNGSTLTNQTAMLTIRGDLNINATGILTNNNMINLQDGLITNNGTINNPAFGANYMNLDSGSVINNGTFNNTGVILLDCNLTNNAGRTLTNNGPNARITVDGDGNLINRGTLNNTAILRGNNTAEMTNEGSWTNFGSSELTIVGTFTNAVGGNLTNNVTSTFTIEPEQTFTNQGFVNNASTSMSVGALVTFTNTGTFNNSGNIISASPLINMGGATFINTGDIELSSVFYNGTTWSNGNIVGNITNNGTINYSAVLQPISYTGIMSGSGNLLKGGNDILTLTGINTYAGGTLITDGLINFNNTANFGTANIDINGGGLQWATGTTTDISSKLNVFNNATLDTNDNDVTLASSLSGFGLTKSGLGTLTLTNTNTPGSTTISGGGIQIGNGGTTGSLDGNITNNADLTFNRSDSLTYSGTISGSGNLDQAGTGTTILTANNTYTGTTTISAGTLQLGNNTATGSIGGNITNNGTLTISRSNAYTFSGTVSGIGSLNKLQANTVILSGTNTYSGGTTVTAGTLQIGDGVTSGSLTGNITNNGNVTFNRTDATSFPGNITGTGSVTKLGGGTLTLTGANSHTGGTTITAGTLQVGNGGTTGDLQGLITNNAALNVNRSNAYTLSSVISGTGTFTQAGSGTTTFTADNTYAGDTTISAGSLSLGSGTATGSVAGNIINNANLIIDRSNAVTLTNLISGTGTVTKSGANTAILTADNTYSGTTTISAGTLQLGNNTATGTVAGNIVNNANLVVDRSNAITLAGNITGTGSLTKDRANTLTLTGTNTYSGGTTINAGTLEIGNGGTAGSITGNIANSGNVTFNRSNAVSFPNNITGTGSVTKLGGGTLTLTGANSHTGGTTITAGTLQVGNGGTTGDLQGLITNNAALNVNRSNAYTLSSVISGTGTFTQAGSGTTTFTADNTYAGDTTISAGSLSLGSGTATGSVAGNIINNANLIIDRSNAVTLTNLISGTGTVTKSGANTAILTADNTYSGTTTISAGTLQLGNNTATGTVAGNIVNNANLVVDRSNAITLAGNITGTGSLTKDRANTLTLTGTNTYSGGTTINAGTLEIGNGGTAGSITGNIANSGNVTFNRSNAVSFPNNITGTGSVTKLGGGTLTLTGANSHTGGTTITAGTLQIGNGGTTGDLQGLITNNAALNVNRSNAYTLSSVISGTGTFTQAGSGTTTFTADNTYAGDTTISAGSLSLGSGTATGSVAGNIINNANLIIDRSNAVTLTNLISGTGTVTKSGANTAILTADNTYSGTTTISAGTLQLGNNTATGTVAGNIINNANLVVDRSNAITLAGNITGTGSLTKDRANTLTLTGTNTYSGGTTINAGTLEIGSGGTAGSITGNIANSGNVTFNRSNAVSFPGNITGTGSVTKLGGGTLTLTGANSHTGGTTITAGTLQIGNGGTAGSISGNIANNATLEFNLSSNIVYNDVISGNGTLVKNGTGRLALTANSIHTGPTQVNSGTINLNGQFNTSAMTVANGATLSGNATVLSLTSNGITAPGNSVGVVNVLGNFNPGLNHVYDCELDLGTLADRIDVGGTANLNGALNLIPLATLVPDTYTILTAAVVNNTFSSVTSTAPLLQYQVIYQPTQVLLQIQGYSAPTTIVSSGNPGLVATNLTENSASTNPALSPIYNIIVGLSAPEITSALNQLQSAQNGQIADVISTTELDQGNGLFDMHFDRLIRRSSISEKNQGKAEAFITATNALNTSIKQTFTELLSSKQQPNSTLANNFSPLPEARKTPHSMEKTVGKASVWVQGYGRHMNQENIFDPSGSPIPAIKANNSGVNAGFDYEVNSNLIAGVTTGYGHTDYKFPTTGKGDANSYRLGFYGIWHPTDDWYVNGAMFYGHHQFKGNRIINFPGFTATANQKHRANHVSLLTETGHDIAIINTPLSFTPYIGTGVLYLQENGYTETGAGAVNLKVRSTHSTTVQGKLGGQISYLNNVNQEQQWYAFIKSGYTYRTNVEGSYNLTSNFVDQAVPFKVSMKGKNYHLFNPSVGAVVLFDDNIYFSLLYEGEIGNESRSHQGLLRVGLKF